MTALVEEINPFWDFDCHFCGKICQLPSKLEEHMRTHTKEKEKKTNIPEENEEEDLTFVCICSQRFTNPKVLGKHILETHGKGNNFLCSMCDKTFASRSDLRNHEVGDHPKPAPSQCQTCFKYFNSKQGLEIHSGVHSETEQYSSQSVEKTVKSEAFKSKLSSKGKSNIVIKNQPAFKCKHCKKEFMTNQRLMLHIQAIHEKIRPFKCEKCEKIFTQRSNLKQHSIVHHAAERNSTQRDEKLIETGQRKGKINKRENLKEHKSEDQKLQLSNCEDSQDTKITLEKYLKSLPNK